MLPSTITVKRYRTFSKWYKKKNGEAIVQKSLSERKKYFQIKNSQTRFCCLYVKLATVKILGQTNKFPLSFCFFKFPLQVKKVIRENSAKNAIKKGNFYFRPKHKTTTSPPKLVIFNNFFFFYIRDHISIISLTQRFKFEENGPNWRYTVTLNSYPRNGTAPWKRQTRNCVL